jgi:2-hydroxychromene-2-carboxylate isomerase
MKTVDVYWSHQSPYCYFSLDRILRLRENSEVTVVLKPVLPGVLRNAAKFTDASTLKEQYFHLDTQRTADDLNLPFSPANPNPVQFQTGTMFRAASVQPRVYELYYQTAASNEMGLGWEALSIH